MRKKGRVYLRNKLVKTINNWQQLGAFAWPGMTPGIKPRAKRGKRTMEYFWRFVCGTSKDGKTILIYPLLQYREVVPVAACKIMAELESRGALVGCAVDIGDAWCIVSNNEKEYKRARRTWYHRDWLEKHSRRENGSREEE